MPNSSAEQQAPRTHTPLLGKTILVTRTREQAAEFTKLLEQLGAGVVLFPTIEIVPPRSWEKCDESIQRLETYDAIVLTSANAVGSFFSRVKAVREEGMQIAAAKKVYAVGEKTRQILEQYSIPVASIPDVADSKRLAIALARSDVAGKRFLFPKGNLAGDVVTFALREHQAVVDEVITYETVPPSAANARVIEEKLRNKEIDLLTFFSPSSVSHFMGMIPREALGETLVAVIGNTTAAAAKNLALPVHITADHATSANLVASIVRYYE